MLNYKVTGIIVRYKGNKKITVKCYNALFAVGYISMVTYLTSHWSKSFGVCNKVIIGYISRQVVKEHSYCSDSILS